MTSEQRTKWVEALRSGKYCQGDFYLCFEGKYCCLGVANEIFDLGQQPTCMRLVPLPLTFLPEKNQKMLSMMNDIYRTSFAEIADYIEQLPVQDGVA